MFVYSGFNPAAAQTDPLPSWNDGAVKTAIVDFVDRVTQEGGEDFVPPAERIAVFDNDGTLWAEQPVYFQLAFAINRVAALEPEHPEWKKKASFKAALDGDVKALAEAGKHAVLEIVAATHAGITTEEFGKLVDGWLKGAMHARFYRPYVELVYQPMLELLDYLRANGFKTFIVSGGGVEFMRRFAEDAYGIPPEQVVGSSGVVKFEIGADGKPQLIKEAKVEFVDDGPGKPVGINRFIGRQPIFAFGNSDGDLQMLQYTAGGDGPRFMGLVHHTDAEREWAYDRKSHIGKLDKALDEATARGWTVVDMKEDWKEVFPPKRYSVSPAGTVQETIDSRIGKLTFESGYPSKETVRKLYDEMDFQRGAQAYLWGIPAVGLNEWQKAHFDVFGAKNGEMLSYLDFAEKLGILTPNYTTPYIATFADLEESGPIVVEIPAGLMAGMILDNWQRVLADLGVVGPDKGNGGKYLILPPGHEKVEPEGYYVVQSPSRIVLAGVRLLGEDKEKAIAELIPGIKTYKWSPDGTGEVLPVRHAGDKKWSQMPPRGMAYWESLNEVVQREAVMERDRLILAQLRFLGIEKGKPFKPDERQKKILEEAVVVGEAMAKANTSDKRVEPPFWPGTNWKHALVVSVDQRMPGYDQLDERAAWFYEAVVVSKGMLTQTPGVGQRYIAAYKDGDGNWLSGGNTYKLHIPPNPPAKQFWSVTVYDEDTRQMVVTEQGRPDLSSRKEDLVKNSDGSVDVYFGPKAPKGKEANWVQTVPGKGWFTYFRFYGPTEAFFDKSWALPDFEQIELTPTMAIE